MSRFIAHLLYLHVHVHARCFTIHAFFEMYTYTVAVKKQFRLRINSVERSFRFRSSTVVCFERDSNTPY